MKKKVKKGVSYEVPSFYEVDDTLIADIQESLESEEKTHDSTIEYIQKIMNIRVVIDSEKYTS